MSTLLTYSEQSLKSQNGFWTAKEICQQPKVWGEAATNIEKNKEQLDNWLSPILKKVGLRIILTGAGTSAYIGEAVAPHLTKSTSRLFEAISTTDIVSNPQQYLLENVPTLLISYGRSGNSPESVAAVKLVDQVIDDSYHLVITCNDEGQLAENAKTQSNAMSILMPEGTLDNSFAMTSSFTSMLVSTLCIFSPDENQLEQAIKWSEKFLELGVELLKDKSTQTTKRIVFLGSGGLQGIAREAALKVLELTSGEILSYCESPLGFRHGPKSLMDSNTEVILLSSSDAYTKLYDQDLLSELRKDDQALSITELNKNVFHQSEDLTDVWASLPYILYCQVFSFFKSMNGNITPDNPCPTGEVNRVVQGVNIYPL